MQSKTQVLTITHTHKEGTLIEGTKKDDGTGNVLSRNGWRWGPSIGVWYIPHSRDRLPKTWKINLTVEALREAGFEVETQIDMKHRSTAEVETDKIARQENRVAALDDKADRKDAAYSVACSRVGVALSHLPEGGEPIKVGHHSERRHRNAIAKADNAMRRSIDAERDAEHARGKAEAARYTTDRRYKPLTVAKRIETLKAAARKLERKITATVYESGSGFRPATESEKDRRREQLTPYIDEKHDQIAYWEGVRAAQIEAGEATGYSQENVQKGDQVKVRGDWYDVVRVNAKSVSIKTPYPWMTPVPYAKLEDLQRPE